MVEEKGNDFKEKDKFERVSYTVYLESSNRSKNSLLLNFKKDFEKNLRENFHYNYCRKLEQLQNIQLFLIKSNGQENFLKFNQKRKKLGNIKILSLDKNLNWSHRFNGSFII